MTSYSVKILSTAANVVPYTPTGDSMIRDKNLAVATFYHDHFRSATGAVKTTPAVGDKIFVHGTGANVSGYYANAICTAVNTTVDGVATQDRWDLFGPWMHRNPALVGQVPDASSKLDSYSAGGFGATYGMYGGIIIESITCLRNTAAAAATLTITELAVGQATGLTNTPFVISVPATAVYIPDAIILPQDGLAINGIALFASSATTADWLITYRGRWPATMSRAARNLSLGAPAI
jgi:hypothetical protein